MTNEQKQLLRHVVLEHLALRREMAFTPDQILWGLRQNRRLEFPATPDDISRAILDLVDLTYVKLVPDGLGSSQYAQATAQGVLFFERRTNELEGRL